MRRVRGAGVCQGRRRRTVNRLTEAALPLCRALVVLRSDEEAANRALPARCARVAQPAERHSYKAKVLGSMPSACTSGAASKADRPGNQHEGSNPSLAATQRSPHPSSSPAQDAALSRREQEFESPWVHQHARSSRASISDGKSSNGRAADSDSANVGSTPTFSANSATVALADAPE
jgi:hypothetical protein